ncbi:SWIM zinc finger family protein [Cohnella sp. LGH]|uniref:SWIM zinc finger family protein n=1 Tax=Cohnella sp. LGH TaxID=1619153 RepID=UPI001ADC4BC4|nr:SWIM zinc finger family protein [Cohnella sp. LGH]QTH41869.1 SWIM zinc finger family protein [Cohnella sp. LGH]
MIPTYELDDDQWDRLVRDVAKHFSEVTISRGFQYFKRGKVVKLILPAERTVKAVVEGGDLYHVSINLDSLSSSRCDCPVGYNCKHMFASLLRYADMHNRPVHSLINAKSITGASAPQAQSRAASYNEARQLAAKKAAEDLALLQKQAKRIAELSVKEWHEWFELATASLMQSSRNTQFINDALAAIYRHKTSLPADVDAFFLLHAHFYVLGKLTKQPQDVSGYMYSYLAFHTHHAASDLQGKIAQRIVQMVKTTASPGNESRARQTLDYLRREMLTETHDSRYYLHHYLQVWRGWFLSSTNNAASANEEEIARIDETANQLALPSSPLALNVAQAALKTYQRKDEEAWELLRAVDEQSNIPEDFLLGLLEHLTETEDWPRLPDWLAEIAPLLNLRRANSVRVYSEYWDLAMRHLPEAGPQMWDSLVSLLPLTRELYEKKLLETGQWQRWMDYQLSLGSDPLEFRVTDLAPIDKGAPEALLPFYHQAVERYVLLKNRDGYKTAVKLLKRLAKLYKRLKRESRWEEFFDAFVDRHSRLRALQEELRKGKLLI